VVQLNFAHSGASLGYFPFGASGQSSRFLRQRRARVGAKVDPRGTLDLDAPIGDDAWPDDSAAQRLDKEISTAASTTDRRPYPEPTLEEKYGGEIPRANPILWRQLDMSLASLQARNINPADIDLVLMDGGANDMDFVATIVNANWTPNWVEFQLRELVKQRMEGFLPWALKTFPNAKFVVTGYYAGVSGKTSVPELVSTVAAVRPQYAALGLAFLVPTTIVGTAYFNDTIARAAAFERATSDALRAAVAVSGGRAVFVSPEFQPEHAYAAPQTLMFRFTERDPAAAGREAECHTIYAPKTAAGSTGQGVDALEPEGFCRKAATFHPNPAGAKRYADRIIAALPSVMPLLDATTRALRVTVQGTTSAMTKTVTVSAVDAASGQPVTGTVAINGAKGVTGAPVTFRACADAPTAVDGAVRGVRAVAARGASVPCTGTVSVAGYPAATFEY
jgi:hypothetical protein